MQAADERRTRTSGLMAPPPDGACPPLMGSLPAARGLLAPAPDAPALSLTGALWTLVAVLAPTVLLLAATADAG